MRSLVYFQGFGEGMTIEQPAIEFLSTNLFGMAPTGSRSLPGLNVNFYGSPLPTLQSGYVQSPLFGQALQTVSPGWVFIDVTGDELAFSGLTGSLTSFTMSTYVYTTGAGHLLWSQSVPHGLSATTDLLTPLTNIRIWMAEDGSTSYFGGTNAAGSSFNHHACGSSPSGWMHFAVTYEASNGLIKFYKNGILSYNAAFWTNETCCANGGYALEGARAAFFGPLPCPARHHSAR